MGFFRMLLEGFGRFFGSGARSAGDDYYTDRPTALIAAGRYDEAIASCTEEIGRSRKAFEAAGAYFSRAQAFQGNGQGDLAIADYSEVIKLAPKLGSYSGIDFSFQYLALSYGERGSMYLQTKEYHRALADLTEAIRLSPDAPVHYEDRARAYRGLGDEASAVNDERTAQQLKSAPDPEEEETD